MQPGDCRRPDQDASPGGMWETFSAERSSVRSVDLPGFGNTIIDLRDVKRHIVLIDRVHERSGILI
jgi:hypothetical protein